MSQGITKPIGQNPQASRMKGKVKWYSPEKRYGFLVDVQGLEYYFNSGDLLSVEKPWAGLVVEFSPRVNQKGPRAAQIQEAPKPASNVTAFVEKTDNRVKCTGCNKLMVPRLILGPPLAAGSHWTPVPKKSVCPFCGSTHQEFAPSR